MSKWEETTLGKIGRIVGGATPSTKDPDNYGGSIPWLTPKDLSGMQMSRYIEHGERNITEQGLKSCACKMLPKGSVLFSSRAPIGYIAIAAREMATNQGFKSIVPDSTVDTNFLYYLLCYNRPQIIALGSGTTFAEVSGQVMSGVKVLLPPIPTQRRIAAVLSALDDKIELNNRINANLEAQAQALFRSWFVDFEPWGGEMPEGWKVVSVGDLNPILETGKRPKGGAVETGIPSIGAENVKQLGVFDFSSAKFIPEDFAKTMTRGRIQGYELLLYKDGGKPGTFLPHFSMFGEGFPYNDCFINEHVFKLDFGNRGFNIFSYFMFQTDEIFQWLETSGMKAAIPGINQNNVLEIKIPHPDNPKIAEFGAIAEPLFARIFKGCNENRSLAALRDALLPKLMRGEIDVEKVEVAG